MKKSLGRALAIYSAIKATITIVAISADVVAAYGEQPEKLSKKDRLWKAVVSLDPRDYVSLTAVMARHEQR